MKTEDKVTPEKECQEENQDNKLQEEQDDVEQQKAILRVIESETESVEEQTQETMVIGKGTELTGNLNSEWKKVIVIFVILYAHSRLRRKTS